MLNHNYDPCLYVPDVLAGNKQTIQSFKKHRQVELLANDAL